MFFFDATVRGVDVCKCGKPGPEPYLRAAAPLRADPRGTASALEDSPNGVASALAAGCVTDGRARPGPGFRAGLAWHVACSLAESGPGGAARSWSPTPPPAR